MSTRIFLDHEGRPRDVVIDGVSVPDVKGATVVLNAGRPPTVALEFTDLVEFVYPDGAGPEPFDQPSAPMTLGQTD
ncbi:MAG: hypothetical protein MUF33_02045 [Candidatus Nanopelagicales bacterium]|nr:hypothetical protein [Candidatus Nanopelagicales bacterium]